ncbi:MAG TPA: terpene cyclase/mutase family protein [Thermogutta sp.]|nr:terpene cyclase/mutase family protein [Thermogutta sp.]
MTSEKNGLVATVRRLVPWRLLFWIALCSVGPLCLSGQIGFGAEQGSAGDPVEIIEAMVDAQATIRYLLAHQRENGAFGPMGHQHTDLAWNYPAARALILLEVEIPRVEDCFRNGQDALYKHPGSHNTQFAWDIYQRAQLAQCLGHRGEDGLGLAGAWKLQYQDRKGQYYFRIPDNLIKKHVAPFCDIPTLAYWVEAIVASGGRIENPEVALEFLFSRQLPNGAFVDAYQAEDVLESNAHVVATAQAVAVIRSLGQEVPRREQCVAWIQSCQDESGGFRWHPSYRYPGNKPDVWYTWAAVSALDRLGAKPMDIKGCLRWLNSLQNPDGGFGDRPGWNSRLYSTYYAVHALDILNASGGGARAAITAKKATAARRIIPEGKYQIYQASLKTPPGGPEMIETARKLRLNFLGVKDNSPNTPPVPISVAWEHIKKQGYPMEVVSIPEQYGHQLKWIGGHPANHVANFFLPLGDSPEIKEFLAAVDTAGRAGLPWPEYVQKVIQPVVQRGSLFYPELDYEMMNAYIVYDGGLEDGLGYNAVVGGLGWPIWDWIRMFPYRERWVGKLPIIVDADAHGEIAKWLEPLDRQRLLYLAEHYDLPHFLDACRQVRTVCVIRGGENKDELAFYGDPAVVEYVKRHQSEWQWW